uniref:Major facilitator superfamily (MFS) profile domain-containing protein n=1 Tax=Chenopodium quinoa TaxID=63459 RepID=A0A803N6M3_CHEQI
MRMEFLKSNRCSSEHEANIIIVDPSEFTCIDDDGSGSVLDESQVVEGNFSNLVVFEERKDEVNVSEEEKPIEESAKSLWGVLAMRAMLGIAEGVALPSMNNMISKWFPKAERARVVGIAMAGFQLGSAIGLILSPILMSNAERSPQISVYELKYILTKRQQFALSNAGKAHKARMIPFFKRLLSKLPTWSLMVANAMHSWGFFVILSWMPLYFNSVYHVDHRQAAWFSVVPWSMMVLVGYFGVAWLDTLIQRGFNITLTRKIMQVSHGAIQFTAYEEL